jgi:hypothetical protein
MALDLDRIKLQGAGELDAAARDVGVRGLRGQFGIGGDQLGGLQHRPAVGGHAAGVDRGAGAGAAFEQAALDQQHVHALAAEVSLWFLSANVGPICVSSICRWRDPPQARRRPRTR